MKNTQSELSDQLQSYLSRLQEVESATADQVKCLKKCIQLCHEFLHAWRQSVGQCGFPDEVCEIYFFKHAKPRLAGHYRYYQRVLQLHLDGWAGSSVRQEQRLMKEMNYIEQVFEHNKSLWQYFQSECTHLDAAYFLRGQEGWLFYPGIGHFDESFSTRYDGQLAELIAMELYSEYIGRRLAGDDSAATIRRPVTQGTLQCTVPAAHATALGYALHHVRFFNQGRVTKKAVMDDFQSNWNINLSNHSQIIDQLKRQHEPDRFLRDLLDGFNDFLGGKD